MTKTYNFIAFKNWVVQNYKTDEPDDIVELQNQTTMKDLLNDLEWRLEEDLGEFLSNYLLSLI
jgi:hypothetical protein